MIWYTDSEILGKYIRAEDKKEVIKTLAELNDCDVSDIINVLVQNGVSEESLPEVKSKRRRKPRKTKTENNKTRYDISEIYVQIPELDKEVKYTFSTIEKLLDKRCELLDKVKKIDDILDSIIEASKSGRVRTVKGNIYEKANKK